MTRTVAALRLPHLPIAAVQRNDPILRGRPLVVTHQGRVVDLDQNARRLGAWPGMAVEQVNSTIVIRPQIPEWESHIRREVATRLLDATPQVEETTKGHWLVELTGTRRVHHAPEVITWDRVLRDLEERMKLNPLSGMGSNPAMAGMAQTAAHHAQVRWLRIFPGQERPFLAPLPVTVLPGVGKTLAVRLNRLGLSTIGQMVRCPEERLVRAFGKIARTWITWGTGQDATRVRCSATVPEPECIIIKPGIQRQKDRFLRFLTTDACDRLGADLRQQRRYAAVIDLELVEWDGAVHRRKVRLDPPEDRSMGIFQAVWACLERLRTRRVLVRRIVLTLADSVRFRNESLFSALERTDPSMRRGLDETLDAIRERFGLQTIRRGVPP